MTAESFLTGDAGRNYELLTAAISRLEYLTQFSSTGPWAVEPHTRLEAGCRCLSCYETVDGYSELESVDGRLEGPSMEPVVVRRDDALLIATLHRTVQPQLDLLNEALGADQADPGFPVRFAAHLRLASTVLSA